MVLFISSSPSSYICFIIVIRDSFGSALSSILGVLKIKWIVRLRFVTNYHKRVRFTLPSIRNCTQRVGFVQIWSFCSEYDHSSPLGGRPITELQRNDRMANRTEPKCSHEPYSCSARVLRTGSTEGGGGYRGGVPPLDQRVEHQDVFTVCIFCGGRGKEGGWETHQVRAWVGGV